ncbi:transcription elongation factor NusA [compost metagenome]
MILQRIREAEREMMYDEYVDRVGEVVTGIIQQSDSRYTLVDLGRVEALLPESGLQGLDAELRSLSQGLASFTAEFDHLAELTGKPADDVVKAQAALAA